MIITCLLVTILLLSLRLLTSNRNNPLISCPSDWLWSRPALLAAAPPPPGHPMWPGRDNRRLRIVRTDSCKRKLGIDILSKVVLRLVAL